MNRLQAILFGFAAAIGAGGIAAYNGAFSPVTPPAQLASQPAGATAPAATDATKPANESTQTQTAAAPAADPAKPAETSAAQTPAAPDAAATAPAANATPDAAAPAPAEASATAVETVAPSFDVLRVEPTGSVLIAGKADPQAEVEILNGSEVIGKAKAEANGDFAIVLDNPLKPGDYQLVLRATRPDGQSATSVETATVSVPDKVDGPVLALVEEPGKPSRIITAPQGTEAKVAMAGEVPANGGATAQAGDAAQPAANAGDAGANAPAEPAKPADSSSNAAEAAAVAVEAVEIEGNKIFIAGKAGGAAIIRLFANDQLLGDAKPDSADRFLLEIQKELAEGDYLIRAEALAVDGTTVVSRTSVPFHNGPESKSAQNAATPQAAGSSDAGSAELKKNVIIRRGDTLWQISRRIYGRGVRYSTIYLANKDVTENPDRIYPGQVFAIPEKTPEGEAANPEEILKRAQQN